jgi:hypothetical protein
MTQLIKEAKRYQYLAGLIKEDEQSAQAEDMFAKLGDELAAKIEDELEGKQLQNEVLATAAVVLGFILSAPVVGIYTGKASKYVFGQLGVQKGAEFGEWLSHNSHDLEEKFKAPIKAVASKFIKDSGKADLVAEAVYAVVVAGLGLTAGMSAFKALQHADIANASVDLIKVATKGRDVAAFAKSIM